ncbi:hypothetical protein FOL47_007280 [Perkinsus chesapeaki]|uniref:Uncharacterized protein n=1 Tax=Perkinsus chesapeaki TaxID=330153 RepID=A0A7J6LM85_PERCH|nr:hypothetical protein FOL47_007280 [Perkinsus chesapeaki]
MSITSITLYTLLVAVLESVVPPHDVYCSDASLSFTGGLFFRAYGPNTFQILYFLIFPRLLEQVTGTIPYKVKPDGSTLMLDTANKNFTQFADDINIDPTTWNELPYNSTGDSFNLPIPGDFNTTTKVELKLAQWLPTVLDPEQWDVELEEDEASVHDSVRNQLEAVPQQGRKAVLFDVTMQ